MFLAAVNGATQPGNTNNIVRGVNKAGSRVNCLNIKYIVKWS